MRQLSASDRYDKKARHNLEINGVNPSDGVRIAQRDALHHALCEATYRL
jgi:hypothetical protein